MAFLKAGSHSFLLQQPPQLALNEDQQHQEANPVENKYKERTSCKISSNSLDLLKGFLHDAAETIYYLSHHLNVLLLVPGKGFNIILRRRLALQLHEYDLTHITSNMINARLVRILELYLCVQLQLLVGLRNLPQEILHFPEN